MHILCGLPCSGKTTLAKSLERDLPALRLGPDEWLLDLIPDRDQAEVGRQRPILNEIQWKLAQKTLELGCNVVLEHGFWSPQERQGTLQTFSGSDIQVHLHYMSVAMSVLNSRLVSRNENLPDDCFYIKPGLLEEWASDFIPPETEELALYDSYKIYESEI